MTVNGLPLANVTDIEGLPLALANGIGVVGVVLIVGWLVWSGRLIPKSTHESQVADLRDRIEDEQHEKSEWRTEARLKDQAISELNEQKREMLVGFQALSDFLSGLRRAGVGPTNGEGDDP